MNNIDLSLQINLCGLCGGVWFTPYTEVENEPDTCPYCEAVLCATPEQTVDLQAPTTEMAEDIEGVLRDKVKRPLKTKQCTFCRNVIIATDEDVSKLKSCSYCSSELKDPDPKEEVKPEAKKEPEKEPAPMNVPEPFFDSIKNKLVCVTFKGSTNWFIKLFKKTRSPVTGVFLGNSTESGFLKIMTDTRILLIDRSEISSIKELS